MDETQRVDAQSTRRLYKQGLAAHPGPRPIYVVCDNARSYQNQELTAWLVTTRLVQVFLPPYLPHLNRRERWWKFPRQKIINTTFYPTKGACYQAVRGFFDRLDEFGPAPLTS